MTVRNCRPHSAFSLIRQFPDTALRHIYDNCQWRSFLIGTYHISTLTIYSKRFGLQAVLYCDAACAITSFQSQKRPFQPLNLTFCPKVGGDGVAPSKNTTYLICLVPWLFRRLSRSIRKTTSAERVVFSSPHRPTPNST